MSFVYGYGRETFNRNTFQRTKPKKINILRAELELLKAKLLTETRPQSLVTINQDLSKIAKELASRYTQYARKKVSSKYKLRPNNPIN